MIAFSWRQFRTQAFIAASGLVLLGLILLATGPHLVRVYDAAVAQCQGNDNCNNPVLGTDAKLQVFITALVLIVPVLVGMFWGAPLVARELETGTFRLAWTQSVSRTRWLLVKLGLVGLASALVGGLVSLAATWWFSPLDKVTQNRFDPAGFGLHGFVPAGYALFAFALAAATGLVFRRTLPAMAITLIGFVVARTAVTYWIRPRFVTPITEAIRLSPNAGWGINTSPAGLQITAGPPDIPNALIVSSTIANKAGQTPSNAVLQKSCPELLSSGPPALAPGIKGGRVSVAPGPQQAFQQCVTNISRKYHEVVSFQPANRFWAFQTYETVLFVAASAVLAGFCVWWVRRRLS